MKTRFAIAPKVSDRRHHKRKKRRQQLLKIISDEKVLLSRLAHNRRGPDRILAVKDGVRVENRIIVRQRIIAVMIAERAFGTAFTRRNVADDREIRLSEQLTVCVAERILHCSDLLADKKRCEQQLRNSFGQWGDRRENKRRRTAVKDRYRESLAALPSLEIMKAAAFPDLPMHARGRRVITLQSIDPKVRLAGRRALGVNKRKCEKMPAVLRPELQERQLVKVWIWLAYFGYRTLSNALRADLQSGKPKVAESP